MNITWKEIKDYHLQGYCELGKIFVRFNKKNQITGVYPMWLNIKIVPELVGISTIEDCETYLNLYL